MAASCAVGTSFNRLPLEQFPPDWTPGFADFLGAIFDPIDQPISAAAHVLYAPGGEQHFARLARRRQFLAEHFEHVAPLRKLQDFAALHRISPRRSTPARIPARPIFRAALCRAGRDDLKRPQPLSCRWSAAAGSGTSSRAR